MTLNGAKVGGGHGAAALYVRRDTPVAPMFYGGGQEGGIRPGTQNVAAAAAFAAALEESQANSFEEGVRLESLRDYFIGAIQKEFPNSRYNGSPDDRLPNNVHMSFPNISSELIVLELDAKGISASAGSACASAKDTGSHVIEALYGKDDDKKWGSVRFSLGAETRKRDIERTLETLKEIFKKYKDLHG